MPLTYFYKRGFWRKPITMSGDRWATAKLEKIRKKEEKVCVIGLGYVGLPLAIELAQKISVIGFDINERKIEMLRRGKDPNGEISIPEGLDMVFTSNPEEIREAGCFIIAVPTPVDRYNRPDLGPLLSATRTVSRFLKRGDVVVYESTVYPGCTREECVPILEESGLKCGVDFFVGYSPERMNPGDKEHTITSITKVVAGDTEETRKFLEGLYGMVVRDVFPAASIEVAESSKLLENIQRDINIALINEYTIIMKRMGISIWDVLECARTKWNFMPFTPGLVGGHCIAVDPYYLIHKAENLGYHTKIIYSARYINDSMAGYIGREIVHILAKEYRQIDGKKVLILGFTFKENVADIRNSRAHNLFLELSSFNLEVEVYDPLAPPDDVKEEYGISLLSEFPGDRKYDCIVLAVAHKSFKDISEGVLEGMLNPGGFIYDIKALWRGRIKKLKYYTL